MKNDDLNKGPSHEEDIDKMTEAVIDRYHLNG